MKWFFALILSFCSSHMFLLSHESHSGSSYACRILTTTYVQQETESSCSLATATMIINALLSQTHPFLSKLETQQEVLSSAHDRRWTKAVAQGGSGVSLDQFARILKKLFHAYELGHINMRVNHVTHISSSKDKLRKALAKLASKTKLHVLIIANFDQSIVIPIGEPAGHFSPLGDYKQTSNKVLVMDVDKEWTGPYWVKQKALLKSFHTIDSEKRQYRGYIVLKVD